MRDCVHEKGTAGQSCNGGRDCMVKGQEVVVGDGSGVGMRRGGVRMWSTVEWAVGSDDKGWGGGWSRMQTGGVRM